MEKQKGSRKKKICAVCVLVVLLIAGAVAVDLYLRKKNTTEDGQEDIVDFGVGDTVKIQFTAYEDTDYEGVITAMDTMTTSGDSTVSYPVTIRVLGNTDALYDGMTADVTFVTAEREDTLFVTRSAIVEQNGKTYVYTDGENGEKVLTEVQTGLRNGLSVEIVSGLSEGQTYYIASRVSEEVQQ